MCGKGSKRRPCLVSREEYVFRWDYGIGKYPDMSIEDFNKRIEEIKHEIKKRR